MAMSQKVYVEVARLLAARMEAAGHYTPETAETLRGELGDLADDFADMFYRDNPRFDRRRFLRAAGVVA